MRLPGAKSEPQRLARPEEVGLAYDFIERARAELLGERGQGLPFRKEVIH
jgi:hypothetical protein